MTPKILYVITDSGVGGAENVLLTLLKRLNRSVANPCGVMVLKTKRAMAAEWEKTGVPVVALGSGRWPSPALFFAARREIRRFKPDIVHAFLFRSSELLRLLHAADRSYKLISSPRVNYRFYPRPVLWLDSFLQRFDDFVVSESRATKAFLVAALGYDVSRVGVVPNGVDQERFVFNADARRRVRREWNISDDEFLVGSAGRLSPQKGYDVLIDALAASAEAGRRLKAVVLGAGPDEAALRAQARARGVDVLFPGERADMPAALCGFDAFVQSSRFEGMSNSLLEAMSVGVPVVATAVDGTLDLADDGKNMLLVKPNDPLQIAVALGLIVERKDLRSTLASNARATAERFSLDALLTGFERIYSQLSKGE